MILIECRSGLQIVIYNEQRLFLLLPGFLGKCASISFGLIQRNNREKFSEMHSLNGFLRCSKISIKDEFIVLIPESLAVNFAEMPGTLMRLKDVPE